MGDGTRRHKRAMPHLKNKRVGTVKVGIKLQGALVFDLSAGLCKRIDSAECAAASTVVAAPGVVAASLMFRSADSSNQPVVWRSRKLLRFGTLNHVSWT